MAEEKKRPNTTRVTRILLAVTLAGLVVFVGSVGVIAWLVMRTPRGEVSQGSYLLVDLDSSVHDAPVQGSMIFEPDQAPPTVTDIAASVRKAASDDRINGVYLDIESPAVGWASVQEIRDALADFRQSGKPCVAYSETYTSGTYYLASECDRVVLAPSGISLVKGLSLSITYYADTLAKLGVEPEFEHVGDFKSAIEPFERNGPSDPAAEAYEALLDSIYSQMVAGIAQGRHMEPDEVEKDIDDLRLSPRAAVDRGLVDAVAFPDAVTATLPHLLDDDWKDQVTKVQPALSRKELHKRLTRVDEYVKDLRADQARPDDKIAVIYAEGDIKSGDAQPSLFGSQALTDGAFKQWMRDAREDDSVKAVVVRVYSPGGSGLASDMMWHEVERMKAAGKPVVVSMGDYAASGGYFMSCNSDWIVAQPATLTGSIGVFGGKFNLAGTYEQIGVHTHDFKRGELSDLLSVNKPFSDKGRAAFKDYLQSFYGEFVDRVASGRHMDPTKVQEIAQGRVWTGKQALDRGLVDQLGGLDDALAKAGDLAKLKTWGIENWPKQKTFFEVLVEQMQEGHATAPKLKIDIAPEIPGADDALQEALKVNAMAGDNGVLAYLPGKIEIK